MTIGYLKGQNFENRINSIDRIDRLYIKRLRAVRLLTIDKNFDGLVGLQFKLFLATQRCLIDKPFDGWAAAVPE